MTTPERVHAKDFKFETTACYWIDTAYVQVDAGKILAVRYDDRYWLETMIAVQLQPALGGEPLDGELYIKECDDPCAVAALLANKVIVEYETRKKEIQ